MSPNNKPLLLNRAKIIGKIKQRTVHFEQSQKSFATRKIPHRLRQALRGFGMTKQEINEPSS
jgi:hypothetical protein